MFLGVMGTLGTWNGLHCKKEGGCANEFAGMELTRIAWGSCAKGTSDLAPMMSSVAREGAQLWLWAGDAIYADVKTSRLPGFFRANSLENVTALYRARLEEPTYRDFVDHTPVIGIYDDHEIVNNCDRTAPLRNEFKNLFLDFLDEPSGSERRLPNRGAYTVHSFGTGTRREVKFVLLDVRYDRDPGADMLGAHQWAWLEETLKDSKAAIHFIVAPVQGIVHSSSLLLLVVRESFGHLY